MMGVNVWLSLTFYTDRFIPEGHAGCTRGPVILVRPKYKGDSGLLAHERVHQLQWILTLGLHSILYLLWGRYRLGAEVNAYRAQVASGYLTKEKAAQFLVDKYDLKITKVMALKALQ